MRRVSEKGLFEGLGDLLPLKDGPGRREAARVRDRSHPAPAVPGAPRPTEGVASSPPPSWVPTSHPPPEGPAAAQLSEGHGTGNILICLGAVGAEGRTGPLTD